MKLQDILKIIFIPYNIIICIWNSVFNLCVVSLAIRIDRSEFKGKVDHLDTIRQPGLVMDLVVEYSKVVKDKKRYVKSWLSYFLEDFKSILWPKK